MLALPVISHKVMAINMSKGFFSLILVLLTCHSHAQSWLPEFRLNFNYRRSAIFKGATLNEFLEYDVDTDISPCQTRASIFHFRVNAKGVVDSIYHEGNLDTGVVNVIQENIQSTNGSWILPAKTKETDHCWFIFPFFVIGRPENCTKEQREQRQQIKILHKLLSGLKFRSDEQGRYLLAPNRWIEYDIK